MKIIFLLIFLLGLFCGSAIAKEEPSKKDEYFGCKRINAFNQEEKEILTAVESFLNERQKNNKIDAYYKIDKKTNDGSQVFVLYVGGYNTDGKPIFKPGGHNSVVYSNGEIRLGTLRR